MLVTVKSAGAMGAALAVLGLALSPVIATAQQAPAEKRLISATRGSASGFTPAAADPRLAAILARNTASTSGFRFTPASSTRPSRALTVAVRSRTALTPVSLDRPVGPAPTLDLAPIAYNLGVSVGWKKFAVSSDVRQTPLGSLQGGRRAMDVGLSYTTKRWTTRVQLAADQPIGNAPRLINNGESVAVDFGSSYKLTRNFDLTAGVRYKQDRERLEALPDSRRDSQAAYVGTVIKF